VTVKPDDFATLKAMYPTAEIMADSGIDHVFIPKLPIYSGGAHLTLDALLRTGWAPSWNHIPADMPIVAMLANHLTAFR
jgi:hypothetical protein